MLRAKWSSQQRAQESEISTRRTGTWSLTDLKEILHDKQRFLAYRPQHLQPGGLRLNQKKDVAHATAENIETCNQRCEGQDSPARVTPPDAGIQQRGQQVRTVFTREKSLSPLPFHPSSTSLAVPKNEPAQRLHGVPTGQHPQPVREKRGENPMGWLLFLFAFAKQGRTPRPEEEYLWGESARVRKGGFERVCVCE